MRTMIFKTASHMRTLSGASRQSAELAWRCREWRAAALLVDGLVSLTGYGLIAGLAQEDARSRSYPAGDAKDCARWFVGAHCHGGVHQGQRFLVAAPALWAFVWNVSRLRYRLDERASQLSIVPADQGGELHRVQVG